MKKNYFLIVLTALTGAVTVQAQEPYAVYNDDDKALTFYYDTQKADRNGMDVVPFNEEGDRGWNSVKGKIQSVVFDASFADCTTLTSTAWWFCLCDRMTSITGLENLHTENVTDMSYMFQGCAKLTGLDLSSFKTDKVENMGSLFWGCYKLESLNLSGWNTKNVTSMFGMFSQCAKLESLDLSGFDTGQVSSVMFMFQGCENLTSLDLSSFNTASMTDLGFMFSGCTNLITLDLSSFNTANVESMWTTFSNCSHLTTIYVGDGWTVEKVIASTEDPSTYNLFGGCESLVGEKGTTYSSNNSDLLYARIDGGQSAPGYLSKKVTTGIKRQMTDERRDGSVYTLGGQRLPAPRKGVNIIGGRKVVIR